MLNDGLNDQLGLFGAVTEKKDAPVEAEKRKTVLSDMPTETNMQSVTVPVEDETARPVQEDSVPAATQPLMKKYAASSSLGRETVTKSHRKTGKGKLPAKSKPASGLVPAGDVRLTANIREDLHLKLKIAAAQRRTTIGELIEDLVERYM
ncbi:MAG: hypothetical protein CXR31_05580 [Geobacter sp.]|nr:MAG: hypothetical protein CXR31_05580 [Geobacter sp.]